MKKLSLPEFKDYCCAHTFDKIIYSSVNQVWYSIDTTISANFVFNNMIMTFNPNIIHLKSEENSLSLKKVKVIRLHDEESLLGKVFTVVCGDSFCSNNNKEYTLIAFKWKIFYVNFLINLTKVILCAMIH